ncbi:sulfotransferase family 2 domain-containing protein [Stappia albiluteola]|nr:sulfotransferase family 2 domain-containing protein [Stappia albiluteola]
MRIRYRIRELFEGSASRRVIFVHIPRCGGSTVNDYFKTRLGSGDSGRVILLNDAERGTDWEARLAQARSARFVGGHFGGETLDAIRGDAFVFTFIRSPLERLISTFVYSSAFRHPDRRLCANSFEEFLDAPTADVLQAADNLQVRQLAVAVDYQDAMRVPRERWLELAIRRLSGFDHVGIVEDYDTHMRAILDKLRMDRPASIRAVNTSLQEMRRSGVSADLPDLTPAAIALAKPFVELDQELYDMFRGGTAKAGLV